MLKTFKQQSLALELLKRHARISIVHKETGIPKALLRNTYRDLHGRSSRPGALKYSTQGLTRTIKKYKEVTLFAVCFLAVHSRNREFQNVSNVILAFDIYKKLLPSSNLDFSAVWVIPRDLNTGRIEVVRCANCGASVLINLREDGTERCVVCNTAR